MNKIEKKTLKGNKKEFVELFSKKSGIAQKDSKVLLDLMFSIIETFLKDGEKQKLTLVGWGTFISKVKKARIYSHPKDKNKKINVASYTTVRFKPSTSLKERISK